MTASSCAGAHIYQTIQIAHLFVFSCSFVAIIDGESQYLVAIDDHILGAKHPYVVVERTVEHPALVNIQGYFLLREDRLREDAPGIRLELVREDGQQLLRSPDGELTLFLTPEEARELRSFELESVLKLGVLLFVLMTAGFALNYVQVYLLQYTGQRIMFDIRQQLFSHIQRLSLAFFDRSPVGRLVTRVTNDTENLNEMYTNVVVNLFKDVFMVIGIIFRHVKLMCACPCFLAVLPVIVVITAVFRQSRWLTGRPGRAWPASTPTSRKPFPGCAWCRSSGRRSGSTGSLSRSTGITTKRVCGS